MTQAPEDTWHRLLADMKRACEDPEARFAVVDAWAAYITQLEAEVERLKGVKMRLQSLAEGWQRNGTMSRFPAWRIFKDCGDVLRTALSKEDQ